MACCFNNNNKEEGRQTLRQNRLNNNPSWLCLRRGRDNVGNRTRQVSQRIGKGLKGLWDETRNHVEKVVNERNNNNCLHQGTRPRESSAEFYSPKRPATMLTAFSHLTLLFLADGGLQHRTGHHLPPLFEPQQQQQQQQRGDQLRVREEQQEPVLPLHGITRSSPTKESVNREWFQDEEEEDDLCSVSLDSTTRSSNTKGVLVVDYRYDDAAQQERAMIKAVLDGSMIHDLADDNERELVESWEDFFFPFGLPPPNNQDDLNPMIDIDIDIINNNPGDLLAFVSEPWEDNAPQLPSWGQQHYDPLSSLPPPPPKIPSRIPFGGTGSLTNNNKDQDRNDLDSFGRSISLGPSQCSNLSSTSSYYSSSSSKQDLDEPFHASTAWRDGDETIVPFHSLPTLFPYHIPSGGSLPGRYYSDSSLSGDDEGCREISFEGGDQSEHDVPSNLRVKLNAKSHLE